MTISLEPLRLDVASDIRAQFSRGGVLGRQDRYILVASYTGVYRPGGSGHPDSQYIRAMAEAAITIWQPEGLILDLSVLDYRGGDDLTSIFEIGDKEFGNEHLPLAVIIGPACEAAFKMLLQRRSGRTEFPWDDDVFRDLESAWAYVEGLVTDLWKRFGTPPPLISKPRIS